MRPLGGNLTAWSGCHVSPFLTSSIPTRVKLPSTLIRFLEAEGAEPAEEGARCHGNTETIRNYWMLDATRWSNATRLIPGHSSSASSQEFGNDFLEALGWKKHQCPLSGERNESGLMGPRKGGGGEGGGTLAPAIGQLRQLSRFDVSAPSAGIDIWSLHQNSTIRICLIPIQFGFEIMQK